MFIIIFSIKLVEILTSITMNYVQYNVNMACMTTFSEIPQVYKRDSSSMNFKWQTF